MKNKVFGRWICWAVDLWKLGGWFVWLQWIKVGLQIAFQWINLLGGGSMISCDSNSCNWNEKAEKNFRSLEHANPISFHRRWQFLVCNRIPGLEDEMICHCGSHHYLIIALNRRFLFKPVIRYDRNNHIFASCFRGNIVISR